MVFNQIVGRPPTGEQQAKDLPIDLSLAGDLGLRRRLRGQHPVRFREVRAVPQPQAFGDPDDLAITRPRGEGLGVEIGGDDLPARRRRVPAIPIGPRRRGHHLAELLNSMRRAAARRMAKLLDLCGQRARPALPEPSIQQAGDMSRRGEREPAPFDGRIVPGILKVEQVVILDKHQAVHDQRRDRAEVRVGPLGIARPVERVPVAVEQRQTGARLFSVNRVAALVDKSGELIGPFCLALDSEMMGVQRCYKDGQPDIAQPLVIGSPFWEADGTVRPRSDREAHVPCQARKEP